MKKMILAMCGTAVVVAGCATDTMEATMHPEVDQPTITSTRADWRNPYGPGWEDLTGKDAEVVATAALTKLCEHTATELDRGEAYKRLNGVVTPDLWQRMVDNPAAVVQWIPAPVWEDWASHGGTQTAHVSVTDEEHPADTEESWARKMVCERHLSGIESPVMDTYLVVAEKSDGVWKLSRLELLS